MYNRQRPYYQLMVKHISQFFDKSRTPLWQRALLLSLVLLVPLVAVGVVFINPNKHAKADVVTSANDNLRTGWYSDEANLSPGQVTGSNFGQLFKAAVDGQVYAQPLVSKGTLLVVTETNHVYGLDPVTGQQKWTQVLGAPFDPTQLSGGCGDLSPSVGITATPVIDSATNIAYFTSKAYVSGKSGAVTYSMDAIHVDSGLPVSGFPVLIQGTASNAPTHTFDPVHEFQRPGLLLLNGVVYAAFGGHCDRKPFEGWVAGVSTSGKLTTMWTDEANDAQNTYPDGGIWQSGGALVSDGSGQIIFASGNGNTPPPNTPGKPVQGSPVVGVLGQSVVRLSVQGDGSLKATDFFSPYDSANLNQTDSDLGSGSPVELPPSYFGTAGHPHLLLQVGKQGILYVMDADNLGGIGEGKSGGDAAVNVVQGVNGVWGKPGVWPGDGGYIYITSAAGGGGNGRLEAYKYSLDGNGNPIFSNAGTTPKTDPFGFGSSSPVITSSGTVSGSAVVWVVWGPDGSGTNAQLRAYNPIPVNGTLQMLQSWPIGTSSKFNSPSVDNGHVYVGTRDGTVLGFGSPVASPLTGSPVGFPTTIIGQTATATATLTASAAETVTALNITGAGFSVGASTPALPATLTAGAKITVPITFAPTGQPGLYSGTLTATTSIGSSNFSVSGNAESANATVSASPTTISFGGVSIAGGSTSQTVTFTNGGAQPLTVNGATLPAAPFSVSGLPANGSTIAANSSVTATVTFTPTTVGSFTDNLVLNTSAGPSTVPLSGSGGQPPKLQITPLNTNLGNVSLNGTAVASFSVSNTGGVDLTITKSKPPASGVGFTAITSLAEGTTIPAGKTLTETVTYSPTAVGTTSDTWTINSSDSTGLQQVNFTGTGVAAVPTPLPSLYVTSNNILQPTTGTTQATVTVSLSAPSTSPVTVKYATKDGTAKAASGAYVAIPATPLTFTPGQTTQTIPVTINGSATHSNVGQFEVTLSSATKAVIATAYGRENIVSPVTATPGYTISIGDAAVKASATGTVTANFPVTLSSDPAPGDTVTVTVSTADGTAVAANGDYVALPATTLTFNSITGASQTVSVTVNSAAAGTTNKTFFANLTNASANAGIAHSQAMGTIVNSSSPALPTAFVNDITIVPPTTGTTTATFTVSLGMASTSTVKVQYATHDKTATVANNDYVATSGTLTFAPGQTSQTVAVTINSFASGGVSKYFYLNLSRPVGAVINNVSGKCNLVGKIGGYFGNVENESIVQNSTSSALVQVPVMLSSPVATGQIVTVNVSTTDGTAVAGTSGDYIVVPSTKLTFAEGQQTILVPIYINPNAAISANKTFTVTIQGASSNLTIVSGSATVTIVSHA